MGIVINAADMNGSYNHSPVNNDKTDGKALQSGRFYAGNRGNALSPVELKRKDAQEKALKVVKDAWNNDRQIDESIEQRRTHCEEMKMTEEETRKHLEGILKEKSSLKDEYQIIEDSDEYRDLQLLEKRQNYQAGEGEALTKEERLELKKIDKKPLTEYQKRSLELNAQALEDKKIIRDAKNKMMDDIADINSIRLERLKSHAMVDADKSAATILEAANKEIIGMLIEEAKDSIDEKMEENEEKADKAAEEQKEEEEKLEDIKEIREWQQAMIEGTKEAVERAKAEERKNDAPDINIDEMIGMVKNNTQSEEVKQSLEDIKNSMKILEADLKGIEVDTEV